MPKTDDYLNARSIARETLLEKNPTDIALYAGGVLDTAGAEKKIILSLLNREIGITLPEGVVRYIDTGEEPSLQEQVSLLHYLSNTTGAALSGRTITFREIPSGDFYYEPFRKRAQLPLVNTFGAAPEQLLTIGKTVGGEKADMGDVSMTFPFFPKVPITLVLWRGDAEFPPEGNILYDASIAAFFNAEEIAFLSGNLVYKLMALARG